MPARPQEPLSSPLEFDERMELHDELFKGARSLVPRSGVDAANDDVRRRLFRATELLERAIDVHPESWEALRALGDVWNLLQDHERAYDALRRAFTLDPPNPAVAADLCEQCLALALGKGAEAVAVARRACALDPSDPGLLANLALSYLIDGQTEPARATVREALERDPDDPITKTVCRLIEVVAEGQIAAPTRWPL